MLFTIYAIIFTILALAVGLSPRSTEIVRSEVLVHTWVKTFHYNLDKVESYQVLESNKITCKNTIRVFAVGWPVSTYGWVWNRDHGIMLAMATDPRHQVLLKKGEVCC